MAVNDLVKTLKSTPSPLPGVSNWDAMKATCLLAGPQTLAGALIPLRGPAPTNINFVSGDYHPVNGLKGNGSSKTLLTNYTNDGTAIDQHVSVFCSTVFADSGNNTNYIGNVSGSEGVTRIVNTGDAISFRLIDWGGKNNIPYPAAPNNRGFLGLSSIPNQSSQVAYALPNSDGIGTRTNYAIYNTPFYVYSNSTGNFSAAQLSFFSVGKTVDLIAMRSALNAYMEAIA
ncbi:MAG TPA: hypothetical protein VNQ90_15650 [Chthoniobacteraceae bacterium]|nr:hypothetical protein [Chthoniobacteraceae bacterium]